MFPLLVVIHETVISAEEVILLHNDPEYYASYHAVVNRLGDIIYLVPPEYKAYAAANSSFTNPFGIVEEINGSVDDFAYHIALESPTLAITHVGYSKEQYTSLAWLCVAVGARFDRIVTHGEIQDPTTLEPKCFNRPYFDNEFIEQRHSGRKIFDTQIIRN